MGFISTNNIKSLLKTFRTNVNKEIEDNKVVNVSELINDETFQNDSAVVSIMNDALNQAKVFGNNAINNLSQFKIEKVDSLPDISKAKENVVYLVPISEEGTSTDNIYYEYILINSKWEKLGTTKVNLDKYDNASIVDQKLEAINMKDLSEDDEFDIIAGLWGEDTKDLDEANSDILKISRNLYDINNSVTINSDSEDFIAPEKITTRKGLVPIVQSLYDKAINLQESIIIKTNKTPTMILNNGTVNINNVYYKIDILNNAVNIMLNSCTIK